VSRPFEEATMQPHNETVRCADAAHYSHRFVRCRSRSWSPPGRGVDQPRLIEVPKNSFETDADTGRIPALSARYLVVEPCAHPVRAGIQ
jgi:hypothetical protein